MNSINKKEIEKFSNMAAEWWDPEGKFKPLHKFNPIRIKYIKENIIKEFQLKNKKYPLSGINVLDIGCGGGLLSEPMCRLGANVTAIDASNKNITIANLHAKKNNLKINYICSSPEKLKTSKKFDVILNMEIVEHVEDVDFFLKSCANLLKKNGLMFVATINKTLKSYIFAIVGAEYVLRWLPIGTHEWEKFVKPEDLKSILIQNNLNLKKMDGMNFNILKDEWNVSKDLSVNYIAEFKKNPIGENKVVFLGNSITQGGGDWNKRYNSEVIVNRGVSGDFTNGVLQRLDEIIFYRPTSVFIMIGINEFFADNSSNPNINPKYVAKNILKIANVIKRGSPKTKIFISTILPINNKQYIDVKDVNYNFLQEDFYPSVNNQVVKTNH